MTNDSQQLLHRIRELRAEVRDFLPRLAGKDSGTRRQAHAELSPIAWHVGHTFFTEAYWVLEVVAGDNTHTKAWHPLYFPEYSQKTGRAARLPDNARLLDWSRRIETHIDNGWTIAWNNARNSVATQGDAHGLMQDNYLAWFIIQHYAQHLETMALARHQMALACQPRSNTNPALEARQPAPEYVHVDAGSCLVGGAAGARCYDNELPAQQQHIAAFAVARRPVSNGEWLAFMQDGGYQRRELWDNAGTEWLERVGARHPQHWRVHPAGGWYCPDPQEQLESNAPVHGICWHEASAFARWAGARLPHEYEWEFAAQNDFLADTGAVWEWCSNALHPYPGFRSFPYQGYSTPWFDGHHRVCRGASRHTRREIRRPGFRNFYPESHRHVFAGLRLATEAGE